MSDAIKETSVPPRAPEVLVPKPLPLATKEELMNGPVVVMPFPSGHKLGKDELWGRRIGRQVMDVLDAKEIAWNSVDMVRFKVSTDTGDKYSQPTIWVGVNPGKLAAGTQTEEATEEILTLLKQHDITDVDVAYRESVIWH
ncbi:hypothetical protein ONZ45_g18183 [Pleurotus djamor]|nr:hypothetical protein ONZ45_g18183 [Pleurotus djamor]